MSSANLIALRATLPVLFGYLPLGLAFGVLFAQLDYAWYYATLMGLAVYAGAAQFLAVGLLAAGTGIAEIALATLLLNARHVFYGLSLAPRFPRRGAARPYLIFGLTDETYSLLSASPDRGPAVNAGFYLRVTAFNQAYWVTGCTLGALLGAGIGIELHGLDFVLTALFVVLALEQALTVREARPFLIALVSALAALLLLGGQHLLLGGLVFATLLLLLDGGRRAWTVSST